MVYFWLSVLSALSVVRLADLATPPALPWGELRVMHTWNSVPSDWESLGPPPVGVAIDLYIALKPHHEDALVDALHEVSNPKHQKYGAHLTKEQVAELVAPHQDTLKIVHSWLEHHGVPSSSVSTSHGGGWLTITGVPVSQVDELLCASYQLYKHTGTSETEVILRTVGYALPAALYAHVQTISPTTHFATPRTAPQAPRNHSSEEPVMVNATSEKLARVVYTPDKYVTPSFLRWLYKTQGYEPAALDKNVLGILSFMDDYPSQADLTQFMTNFREDAKAATFTVEQVNGGEYDPSHPGNGGSLNTQYSEAMAYPTPHIFYSAGGVLEWMPDGKIAAGDAYLEWLNYLLAQQDIPPTISISYSNPEPGFPEAYARALCRLFAQLGTRGVSVIVGSGDYGVGPGDCYDRSGSVRFVPMFPASCPWVTSVGGTTSHDPEVAAVFSGGGFSRYFLRPKYQNAALRSFLRSLGSEHALLFRRKSRGIPDIAAQAQQFVYIRDTGTYISSGTLCSASIVAGIVSLLNDYQLSQKRATLGFLNPWLYSHGLRSLNDITLGSNPGCGTNGFSAIVGWDPVTGLGTLDFEILQVLLDLDY